MTRTPTTEELRDLWVDNNLKGLPREASTALVPAWQEAFDSWLEQVKAGAAVEALATIERVRELVEEWERSAAVPVESHMRDWQARHAAQVLAALDGGEE